MEQGREQVIAHILTIDRGIYEYLRAIRMPEWAQIELTMPQLKVLFLAAGHPPMAISQVARALGMTLSTASGVVDRLVTQRLVRREEDPGDRRIVLLRATPEGQLLLEKLLTGGLEHFRDILERLPLEELRVVARAIDLLHDSGMALAAERQSSDRQRDGDRRLPVPSVGGR